MGHKYRLTPDQKYCSTDIINTPPCLPPDQSFEAFPSRNHLIELTAHHRVELSLGRLEPH
jgi:hypothetical protein